MLWFELLMGFLFTYIAYNGIVLLGSDIRYIVKDMQDPTPRQSIFIPATALLVFALIIFVVDYPLGMMLFKAVPLNPAVVGGEIVVAFIIRLQKITNIL